MYEAYAAYLGGSQILGFAANKLQRVPKGEVWLNITKGTYQKGGTFLSKVDKYIRSKLFRGSGKGNSGSGTGQTVISVPDDGMKNLLDSAGRLMKHVMDGG